MSLYKAIPLLSIFLLAGCGSFKITPPAVIDGGFCSFPKYELTLDETPPAMAADLMNAMEQNSGPVLYLSGGGQHGAFGAGFISQWASNHDDGLPEFSVVTGVSTGALLSLAAFTDTPKAAVDGYSITSEDQVLRKFVSQKGGKLGLNDYLKIFRKGAMTDLVPFRLEVARIMREHDLIRKIADRAALNRKLYIAAVDVDSGKAVAFDMTVMAERAMQASGPARKTFLTNCMVEAIAASSAAPLAALPVFIDNRMYIDGGVRFGMFSDRIGTAIEDYQGKMAEDYVAVIEPRDVYLIINGDQRVKRKCAKADPGLCTAQSPTGPREGAHKDWSLLSLVARVVDVLSDQVYNFSEFKIRADSQRAGYNFQSVKIEKAVDGHTFSLNGETKTCAQWRAEDKVLDNPIQFHPRYMKCLIDFGKTTAQQKAW